MQKHSQLSSLALMNVVSFAQYYYRAHAKQICVELNCLGCDITGTLRPTQMRNAVRHLGSVAPPSIHGKDGHVIKNSGNRWRIEVTLCLDMNGWLRV